LRLHALDGVARAQKKIKPFGLQTPSQIESPRRYPGGKPAKRRCAKAFEAVATRLVNPLEGGRSMIETRSTVLFQDQRTTSTLEHSQGAPPPKKKGGNWESD